MSTTIPNSNICKLQGGNLSAPLHTTNLPGKSKDPTWKLVVYYARLN